ncbi:unnamed protein product [Trifolium pratense]|uniref:Uncharacterized protein n=1 Tax=Trifolium pratense TaxID=57577 RepID=A0ACB0K2Q4_TRIPR|nr:unnamed protein product [Trifolium pratense]
MEKRTSSKTSKNSVTGHVFHNYPDIRAITMPKDPTEGMSQSDTNFQSVLDTHLRNLEVWTLGEISAKNIIINRLDPCMCPRTHEHMTPSNFIIALLTPERKPLQRLMRLHWRLFSKQKCE